METKSSRRMGVVLMLIVGCGGSTKGASEMGVHFSGDAGFKATGDACLAQIGGLGGLGERLLGSLASGSVEILHSQSGTSGTSSSMKGEPATIEWSTQAGTYGCSGAPKAPCATLIHELVHAQENIEGTGLVPGSNGQEEWGALRAENWLLSQLGLCQRTCYDADGGDIALPTEANVSWPLPSGMQQVSVVADGMILCQVMPTMLTLTIDNQSPDQILVEGGANKEMICGGTNPDFRETQTRRSCTLTLVYEPSRNPYAVPLTTLVAYVVAPGAPHWTDDSTADEPCGGNAYAEYCQIAMGKTGSTTSPLALAMPSSRTVHVKLESK